MNQDQAYMVVKDQSVLPEFQLELDRGWRDAAESPELPIESIRRFVDIDKALDPLRFIDFPTLLRRK